MTKLSQLALCSLFSIWAYSAQAIIINLEPESSTPAVGDSVDVDLTISGLGNGAAPSLGAYFLEIFFDATVLDLDTVTHGTSLGDPDDFFETDVVTDIGSGDVSLEVISFLDVVDLDALQGDSFLLATLTFNVLGMGGSDFSFGPAYDFSDAPGENTLVPTFTITQLRVGGGGPATPVNAPNGIALLLLGLISLATLRRRSSAT
ncbi:MAG: cohesin domain-containing protein [Pseudomonadota bacterium]